ncbi:MAG: aldehyde dehydrogenase [Ignavibacteriae bacterium]|nr:aldehyde dehydrogenase [Ignavibacteriota bacterium]MCB9244489.1 aldehyde dehydrogenase [Ignavibacteriales bacterium]
MEKIRNYIGGIFTTPYNSNYFNDHNPATGEVYTMIPDSTADDVEIAVQAAKKAFPMWSNMPADDRSNWLMKVADKIRENLEKFALAEANDNGKPLWMAREIDIPRAIKNFEFYATAIRHFASEAHVTDSEAINYTIRQPLGVVGAISPWNLPLYLFSWKIAPALAAGNCVVAKPSEITPMTAYLLSELCIEIGFPEGVLNIIHGYGNKAGAAIVENPGVDAITFTGGTATGEAIARAAAPKFKKLSLELGGKNPNIIFADCNYEEMLETTIRSSFSNQGEICLCGSRIFIEMPLYEKFRKDFVAKVKELKVGDPLEPDTKIGAIVSKEHYEKILSYIDLAIKDGGRILTGGDIISFEKHRSKRCQNGWFIEPTVIEGLDYTCRVNQEEIFGPVVTLIPFETEEQVVMMANSTKYGLASILWTENLTRAHRIASQLDAGIVWVNCWMLRDLRTPFGGVKASGVGREGGYEALEFFTEAKNVCVKIK